MYAVLSYDSKLDVVPLHYGVFMLIKGSSAIASVNFDETSEIGIKFTSQDTEYKFLAQDVDLVRRGLESTVAKNDSVGRLIADYRKSGQLTQV